MSAGIGIAESILGVPASVPGDDVRRLDVQPDMVASTMNNEARIVTTVVFMAR